MHTCVPSHRLKRSWHSCPRWVNASNKNTPSMHHPQRWNVTYLNEWIKKRSHMENLIQIGESQRCSWGTQKKKKIHRRDTHRLLASWSWRQGPGGNIMDGRKVENINQNGLIFKTLNNLFPDGRASVLHIFPLHIHLPHSPPSPTPSPQPRTPTLPSHWAKQQSTEMPYSTGISPTPKQP